MECNTLEYLEIEYWPSTPSFSIGYQSTLPVQPEEKPLIFGNTPQEEVPKRRIGFI